VIVEDQAIFGGICGVHQFCRVGRMAMIGGFSRVTQDVPPYMICEGNPATVPAVNLIGIQRRGLPDESIRCLREAHRILYRSGLNTSQAVDRIEQEVAPCPEVRHLLEFIRGTERGITR
jgi:UDP-N-acetylglucosamine acyltransferase